MIKCLHSHELVSFIFNCALCDILYIRDSVMAQSVVVVVVVVVVERSEGFLEGP
jgi:hypothetical protein